MRKVISIHEYTLAFNVKDEQFEQAIREAKRRGLFQLPGLEKYHFIKGIRGSRQRSYALYGFMLIE